MFNKKGFDLNNYSILHYHGLRFYKPQIRSTYNLLNDNLERTLLYEVS